MATKCSYQILAESDSQIAFLSISGKFKVSRYITNLIKDIMTLTNDVKNVNIFYCNRKTNALVDNIAKKAQTCISQNVVLC